jgi:hypothetical protein
LTKETRTQQLYSCFPKAPTVALARKFSPSLDAGPPGDGWMMILHPAVYQQFMGRGQFANDLNFFVHREKTHWQCIYNLDIPFYMPKHPRLRKVRSNRRFGRFALINEKCSTTRIIPEIIPTIFQEPIRERLVSCDVEVVSGSPLLHLAPCADPILSSASLSRHCQSDLTWLIQRRLLTDIPML